MTPSESIPDHSYRIITPRLVIRCLVPKDAIILQKITQPARQQKLIFKPLTRSGEASFHNIFVYLIFS